MIGLQLCFNWIQALIVSGKHHWYGLPTLMSKVQERPGACWTAQEGGPRGKFTAKGVRWTSTQGPIKQVQGGNLPPKACGKRPPELRRRAGVSECLRARSLMSTL